MAILETEGDKLIPIAKALLAERQDENERWKASDEAGREAGLMLDPMDVAVAVMAERKRCEKLAEEMWNEIRRPQ